MQAYRFMPTIVIIRLIIVKKVNVHLRFFNLCYLCITEKHIIKDNKKPNSQ